MPKVKSALKNRGRQAGTADAAGSAGGARQGMVFNTGENSQDERCFNQLVMKKAFVFRPWPAHFEKSPGGAGACGQGCTQADRHRPRDRSWNRKYDGSHAGKSQKG